jgi:predicted GNAT superfamily acetyltransferase
MAKAEAVATRQETSAPPTARPQVRLLTELNEFEDAVEVIARVWGRSGGALLPVELLRAYAHAGDPVIGAYEPSSDELIGICLGFLAAPDANDVHLHSHMTGVVPGTQHRGIGVALKSRQRDWCLERGITDVRWTVDPILAANAWFNIQKLGATAHTYLPEFYGEMADDLNRGEVTDRLEMTWAVNSDRVAAALSGNSPNGRAPERTVPIPSDYRQIRQNDPELAAKLRLEVRNGLMSAFDDGLEISGFSRERGYLLSPRS